VALVNNPRSYVAGRTWNGADGREEGTGGASRQCDRLGYCEGWSIRRASAQDHTRGYDDVRTAIDRPEGSSPHIELEIVIVSDNRRVLLSQARDAKDIPNQI